MLLAALYVKFSEYLALSQASQKKIVLFTSMFLKIPSNFLNQSKKKKYLILSKNQEKTLISSKACKKQKIELKYQVKNAVKDPGKDVNFLERLQNKCTLLSKNRKK